jgi:hypothetical protein
MTSTSLLLGLPLVLLSVGCTDAVTAERGGPVSITIQQSATGETTSAGTFAMSGTIADEGTTTEVLSFGGPLTQSPVPLTFRRTLVGRSGTTVLTGSATLSFTSPSTATIAGTWQVESGAGSYGAGRGTLTGSADFGITPPRATITYAGELGR